MTRRSNYVCRLLPYILELWNLARTPRSPISIDSAVRFCYPEVAGESQFFFGDVARRRFVLFNWPLVEIINCSKISATRDTLQLAAAMLSGDISPPRGRIPRPRIDILPPPPFPSPTPYIPRENTLGFRRPRQGLHPFLPSSHSLSLPRHEQLISPVEAGYSLSRNWITLSVEQVNCIIRSSTRGGTASAYVNAPTLPTRSL